MKDEELEKEAGEYAKPFYNMTRYDYVEERTHVKEAYLAGAKENRIEWHDLRKDPNDLPRIGIRYLVFNKYGATLIGYWNGKYFVSADEDTVEIASPIAWCEIPQFKE